MMYTNGQDIALADSPSAFAQACVDLLAADTKQKALSEAAWQMVASRFSWDQVSRDFEEILLKAPSPTLSR